MKSIIFIFFFTSSLFSRLTSADESPWSFARGTGWNTYTQGGTGSYGQGFNNLLYQIDPNWQVGLALQFGSSFTQVTGEIDYKIKNYYVGLQFGPTWYQSISGFGFGPMVGADWDISRHWALGVCFVYQWLSWPNGQNTIGTTSQAIVSPFLVLTYQP